MALIVLLQKKAYKKGYHAAESAILTNSNHPVSFFRKFVLQVKKLHIYQ